MIKIFEQTKKVFKNEYFIFATIIVFALVVRLYKINNPIADWHSWRQADTASVSKIYFEEGINLLYPRYHDISSIQTGIYNPKGLRFVEFPLFNALHALLARLFPGISFDVIGRALSILFSLFSVFFIYLIGKRTITKWGGILAAFFFAFLPYNIYFSRVVLPEPMATSIALCSLYLFLRFIRGERYIFLYASGLFFAVSLLIKPFTFFYILPIGYLLIKKYGFLKIVQNVKMIFALAISIIPFFLWRIWINNFPSGIPHFSWAFNGDSIRFRPAFWRWIIGERLGNLILGIWGNVIFVFGLLKTNIFNSMFILGMFLYTIVFATASVRHDYYQIFVIPAVSLLLAQGSINLWQTKEFNRTLARIVLVGCVALMFGMGAYQVKDFYKINHPEIVDAGNAVKKLTPKDALVVAPYNGDTAFLYQTGRSGWPVLEESFDDVIKKGASYYVSVNFYDPDTKYVEEKYKVLEKTDTYIIADLRSKKK